MRQPTIFSLLILSAIMSAAQSPTARPLEPSQPNQPAPAPMYTSPEVHPDGSVTFRLLAPNAKEVSVVVEGKASPMQQDPGGMWTLITQPYSPEIYSYRFRVDGAFALDVRNPQATSNLVELTSTFLVPGNPPMPWEIQNIPHGVVTHHVYTTSVVLNAPANQDEYYVYTPPNFNPKTKYPVLYLLHGYSDGADGWLNVGKANYILDSLIATGKARPMIVVMTLGYGNLAVLKPGRTPELNAQNTDLYSTMLINEVIPRVESEYPVLKDRDHRAIAGLSMGGGESLLTGLNHTDLFGYIGTFSAGLNPLNLAKIPAITPQKANLHLLWMACGVDDALLKPNRTAIATLKSQGLPVTAIETPGHHQWPVWRDNLINFAPLLFQK